MTFQNDTGEIHPVEQRAYRYPGCAGLVFRWFIIGDLVPMPYYSFTEAMAEWLARQNARLGSTP